MHLPNSFVCVNLGKRAVDERLSSTQIVLQQQEETMRRADRERRALTDRVKDLERALQASEAERKHIQVQVLDNNNTFLWQSQQ